MSTVATEPSSVKKSNLVRVRVSIQGTRPLWQHQFGPDAIPLEKQERTGVAGNDPEEWKRGSMVTTDGQLYIRGDYVFGCFRNAARHTKKGKGSLMPLVEATLQIEDPIILLDRWLPKNAAPSYDPTQPVYIDVRGVVNKNTKSRNVRYRLAASSGYVAPFTILWDKTIVSREQMRAVAHDAGILQGLGDGLRIGMGRFCVMAWEELTDAQEKTAEGDLGHEAEDRIQPRRRKVRAVQEASEVDENGELSFGSGAH